MLYSKNGQACSCIILADNDILAKKQANHMSAQYNLSKVQLFADQGNGLFTVI